MDTHQHAPGVAVAPDFLAAMAASAVMPLWDRYHQLLRAEPSAPDRPFLWPWATLQPFITRAVAEATMDKAERRVLMLVNPDFAGKVITTTNLFAGIQILEPGEAARPHRHSASALRLVMEGEGGATIVDGQYCVMKPGDLILTPNWAWHEHVNTGQTRVVWLDGLDLPLTSHLGAIFAEGGATYNPRAIAPPCVAAALAQGGIKPCVAFADKPHSPMFRYSWRSVLAALDAAPDAGDGSRRVHYTNPVDGGPVMPTMDCYALRLAQDRPTGEHRTTANAVCLVVEGEGMSSIGGVALEWRKHDVFTVPHWNWASHRALSPAAHLFMLTDREVLRRTGLLREETGEN